MKYWSLLSMGVGCFACSSNPNPPLVPRPLATVATARPPATPPPQEAASQGVSWIAFNRAELERLGQELRTVLVLIRADGDPASVKMQRDVVETPEVRQALADTDAVAMRADFTNKDPMVEDYMEELGTIVVPTLAVVGPYGFTMFGSSTTAAQVATELRTMARDAKNP